MRGVLPFTLQIFAKQCVELYEQLSGKKARHFRTPHCDGGTLVESDNECVGQLAASSAKLVMKPMCLGRISHTLHVIFHDGVPMMM